MSFSPTHVVSGGASAWNDPDGTGPPAVTLEPGTEVAANDPIGGWVYVTLANGWSGWVDAARITPLGGAPAEAGAGAGGLVPASVGQRFGARLIDVLFFLVAMFVVGIVFGGAFAEDTDPDPNEVRYEIENPLTAIAIGTTGWFLYEAIPVGVAGRTPGKRIIGLRVVGTDGGLPGMGRATRRWALPASGNLVPFFGWAWTLVVLLSPTWSPNGRGWHDRVSDTVVVRAN